ncbi:SDR family oxidoreductase [Actinacidiphila bryophytorum]|uniref:NAD(P)H:quinone oxidoreductase n=1 Tax=Actinacidiphila bryophytorum TaxID=1436133 RepID=A0A9W4GWH9_9ACTN|nr:SDR family oxidoreductase [Actinacidiphila bryophytorum]MBM9439061.1 SDR family oxidoreductase [Actinacidiphila bryophytorum]MBN6546786.1 SDR family oxidoreductase [Actinacidiphila bryophytorum]CAG7598031.1 NAD(P)H:quinone oxidoreductase [Actinacidiphila bryophytorum]
MSIVVTGATGHLGRLVIADLLERGVEPAGIAAVVRRADKAADLAAGGVQVRVADYDNPASLKGAFAAGDRVLLVSGNEVGRRIPQHTAVVDAAAEAGVALLAYTGVLGGPAADFVLADEHKATEEHILASGLPYVFLRNGWYTEVYTANLPAVLEHGVVIGNAGDGRVSSAARADYAAAAAAVLAGEGHENKAYDLSGDTAWSFPEYAATVAEVAGREVAYHDVSAEERQEILVGVGVPADFAAVLVDVDRAIGRGLLAGTSGELARLIGRPTTPLRETVAVEVRALGA